MAGDAIEPAPRGSGTRHSQEGRARLLLRVLLVVVLLWLLESLVGMFRVVETREPIGVFNAFKNVQKYRVTRVLSISGWGEPIELGRWSRVEEHEPDD